MPYGTPSERLAALEAKEVNIVFYCDMYQKLQSILFPSDRHPFADKPERGAFCVLRRSTGTKRLSLLVSDVIHPESPDDLSVDQRILNLESYTDSNATGGSGETEETYEPGFTFSKKYHTRAIQAAKEQQGGLLRVHTHPGGVRPSSIDRQSALRIYKEDVDRLLPGSPLAAGITNKNGDWSARVYEFIDGEDAEVSQASSVRIAGPRFKKIETLNPSGSRDYFDSYSSEKQDSSIQIWGRDRQETLGSLRVGLVGCGGVGSILATKLPRLGIGELVLADFDRLEMANANRADGATSMDIRQSRLKTKVAQREAHKAAVTPHFDSIVVDGSVVEESDNYTAVPELLDCDIIISAVDSARPRKVLDQIASAHCIPVIHGGSLLHVDSEGQLRREAKLETSITGPGFACFECQRIWKAKDVEWEREHPRYRGKRGYIEGGIDPDDEPRNPSVISYNTTVAGLIQQRLQALVLGTTDQVIGTFRLTPMRLEGRWTAQNGQCKDDCNRAPIAGGDQYELSTGTDWTMRYERSNIPMPETKTIEIDRTNELLKENNDQGVSSG